MAYPKSLYNVWNEYLLGVGGRKPSRLFCEAERGRVKFTYSRRKVIWDVVRKMVSLGHTAKWIIALIYEVYGPQTSVSDIINRLRRDKNNGTLNLGLIYFFRCPERSILVYAMYSVIEATTRLLEVF
jgi:hypothetical protein